MTEKIPTKREMIASLAKALGIEGDPATYIAEVIRTGDKIILPEGANIPEIVEVLMRKDKEEKQPVKVNTTVAAPPWDGALALQQAIQEELGIVMQNETFNWLTGRQPPQELEVEIELGKTMTIKWGEFALPGMGDAAATTAVNLGDEGVLQFSCTIVCQRRYQTRARKILDNMRAYALRNSIHKGKAFSLTFLDQHGERQMVPTPKFFDLTGEAPIFRRELEAAIERNVFVPMKHADELRKAGHSLKRGVLFAGNYGTGKTMLATHIARTAVEYGWTFLYVKNSEELPYALKYAQRYQPVVVFAEDVDRIAGSERTDEVNNLLNQLDGVDSKAAQIMTVLTSNHSKRVNEAMRRPGRIDLILQVQAPDAETVGRMVYAFCKDRIEPNADLTGIGEALKGLAPAYVKEACGRAQLESLRRTGKTDALISGEDLKAVGEEVRAEKDMFSEVEKNTHHDARTVAEGFRVAANIIDQRKGMEKEMGITH